MQRGQSIFKIRGMQRDLSVSAFNSQYSYENKNIRIMSTDDNTMLSISNEKGNISPYIYGIGDSIDRKSTRLNSSHMPKSRMPSSA